MHSPESFKFLDSIESLKHSCQNIPSSSTQQLIDQFLDQTFSIIETFILPQSEMEVNIGRKEKEVVMLKYKQLQSQWSESSSAILEPVKIWEIFEEARIVIMTELKQDVFPRFIRSQRFISFIQTHDKEFLDKIGLNLGRRISDTVSVSSDESSGNSTTQRKKVTVDYSVRPEFYWKNYQADASIHNITQQDVKFVNSLTLDSNIWQLFKVGDKKKGEYFASFVSKQKLSVFKPDSTTERQVNPQKLYKFTGVINHSLEELLFTLTNPAYMMDYDNQLSVVEQLDYLNGFDYSSSISVQGSSSTFWENENFDDSSSDGGLSVDSQSSTSPKVSHSDDKFSSSICLETYPFGWPISNRDFLVTQSLIYEAKTQRYILVKKSISHPNYPKRKGTTRGFIVGGWTIQRVTENQTRFCFVSFTDMDLNERVFNQLCKKKGKRLFDGLNQTLDRNSENGFLRPLFSCGLLETLEDFLKFYKLPETILKETQVQVLKKQKSDKFKSFEIDGSLVRLIYVSRYDESKLSSKDFDQINQVSNRNNQPLNLSGILLSGQGVFYQVLEGDPKFIYPTYERIKKDSRHFDVWCVSEESGVKECERQFSNWAMKCVDLVNSDHYLAQFMRNIIETLSKLSKASRDSTNWDEENHALDVLYQASKQLNDSSKN